MKDMTRVDYEESGDLARLEWTLKTGSSPLKRIYSTLKHLRSRLSFQEVKQMVESEVAAGNVLTQPHPLHDDEFFYLLAHETECLKNVEERTVAVSHAANGE